MGETKVTPASEAKLMYERIDPLFKRMYKHRYIISIANDIYDKTYNVFFNVIHEGERTKSTPIHTIHTYTLEYLEQVIKELRQYTQLSITYFGFTGEVWPERQTIIQAKKNKNE